jgi:hypothetical protein
VIAQHAVARRGSGRQPLPLHIGRDELCPGAIGLALEIGAERQAGARTGGPGQACAIRAIGDGRDRGTARDFDRAVLVSGKLENGRLVH